MHKPLTRAFLVLTFLFLVQRVEAFTLLGPYTDWMVSSNNYQQPNDIGGPMNLGEEYRWNTPTITYAFDQSFIDYFGSNGVAAVESAIQTLNNLPAASNIVTTNYPADTRGKNFTVATAGGYDLKSFTLAILLEQLGLGQPTRNILDIRTWDPALLQMSVCGNSDCPNLVNFPGYLIQRNFDPDTLTPSFSVNGTIYGCFISGASSSPYSYNLVYQFPVDPLSSAHSAVADTFAAVSLDSMRGTFYTGLTADDAGGLRYLLSATNVNWESLSKDFIFIGHQHHANKRLGGVWRPGVEKITFVPQPQNKKGKFKTLVVKTSAFYVTNGVTVEQSVKRVISRPDILFSAADISQTDWSEPMFSRTGTSNWINNATQNQNPSGAGSGVIASPVKITFDELGPDILTGAPFTPAMVINQGWASFDQSTNPPLLYPANTGQNNLSVRLRFFTGETNSYTLFTNSLFQVNIPYGRAASLQTSTNNTDWNSLATVTNTGSVVHWDYYGPQTPISFRIVLEAFRQVPPPGATLLPPPH